MLVQSLKYEFKVCQMFLCCFRVYEQIIHVHLDEIDPMLSLSTHQVW
jgi:hypothetical protein